MTKPALTNEQLITYYENLINACVVYGSPFWMCYYRGILARLKRNIEIDKLDSMDLVASLNDGGWADE